MCIADEKETAEVKQIAAQKPPAEHPDMDPSLQSEEARDCSKEDQAENDAESLRSEAFQDAEDLGEHKDAELFAETSSKPSDSNSLRPDTPPLDFCTVGHDHQTVPEEPSPDALENDVKEAKAKLLRLLGLKNEEQKRLTQNTISTIVHAPGPSQGFSLFGGPSPEEVLMLKQKNLFHQTLVAALHTNDRIQGEYDNEVLLFAEMAVSLADAVGREKAAAGCTTVKGQMELPMPIASSVGADERRERLAAVPADSEVRGKAAVRLQQPAAGLLCGSHLNLK
ncbi:hypothetical protein CYMTET_11008 [Cymbomonas tetramitiformis]|uniref:Uncharacterized protein n=1 Tax=Cymbomonas tetramitiformis TaxID=36881 RepID=A0AAE0GNF9_9CHLO|nr:hypothetical protein CYMTET_11008 [Cymbomonas tetramitiformis]